MTLRNLTLALIACSGLLLVAGAHADEDPLHKGGFHYNQAGQTPPHDDGLYQDLGGSEKIAIFTKDFVGMIVKDEQIGHFFQGVNTDRLTRMLTAQFIELSGGPAAYKGREMAETHAGMGVTNADFNRLAEILQIAMDNNGVPFSTQNRLVALLASMQRDVVTK
jgi:hemoglobin